MSLSDIFDASPKSGDNLTKRIGAPSVDFDHYNPQQQVRDLITNRNTETAIGRQDVVKAFVLRVEEPGDINYDETIKMGVAPGDRDTPHDHPDKAMFLACRQHYRRRKVY